MVGSPIYMGPEILKGFPYTTKADIWSFGVVLFEMLFGFCPYEEKSIPKLLALIDTKELLIPRAVNNISFKIEDTLRKMLKPDYKQRIDWQMLYNTYLDEPKAIAPL